MTGTAAEPFVPLAADEIHVWQLRYRRAQGRAPLCALLGRYLGVAVDHVELVEGAHGRPELGAAHDRTLAFNWSHSGEQALIAVARGVVPGVDLERQRDRPRALELARRYFLPDEARALAGLPESARGSAFLQRWTAKEAVLKAHGRGIGFGLHRLRIALPRGRISLEWLDGDEASAWRLHPLDVGPGYLAALAWRGGERRIRLRRLAETGAASDNTDLA